MTIDLETLRQGRDEPNRAARAPRPRRHAGLPAMLAGLVALFGLTSAPAAHAQGLAPSAAPAAWVRYAEAATGTIAGWLGEEGEAPAGFRAYLHQTRSAADQPTPPLPLKVWIEPDGRVSRIEFTPFADEQANIDLRTAIAGRRLPSAPPKDMRLPLRLAVQLDPAQPPRDDAIAEPEGDTGAEGRWPPSKNAP